MEKTEIKKKNNYHKMIDLVKENVKTEDYRTYLINRLEDLEESLIEEGLEINNRSFRKTISFICNLERRNILLDFSLFIDDDGNIILQRTDRNNNKFLYIKFSNKENYYMNRTSDLEITSGFFKLFREVRNFLQ